MGQSFWDIFHGTDVMEHTPTVIYKYCLIYVNTLFMGD